MTITPNAVRLAVRGELVKPRVCWLPLDTLCERNMDKPNRIAIKPVISIIMPVLNEGAGVAAVLAPLAAWRARGHEVLVVDGGSADDTMTQARPHADQVLSAPRGRARQMNAGAAMARGEVLLFLHADTLLPLNADHDIIQGLHERQRLWGRFDVRLSGSYWLLRVIERLMNARSRYTGIATGDQALFVRREVFKDIGGYADIPLMEDIALCKKLKKYTRPLCLRGPAFTSSRRWERDGVWRTVLLMWSLRLAYFLGVAPSVLARRYFRHDG